MEKVLIVEDDDTSRALMKRVIDKLGFSTLVAQDGAEALALFEREHPKIVVTDLRMPQIGGMELLRVVKRLNPRAEVVLVTAHGDYDTAINALREGAADYLRKPIDLEELESALFRCKHRLVDSDRIRVKPVVMIVEDELTARAMLGRVYEREGWEVITAASGDEAITKFDERKIDILVTDLQLPGVGGLQVLHEFRKRSDDCEVVVVTGHGDETTAIQAMKEGAFFYLRKPIDLEQLLLASDKALEKLRLRRSVLFKSRELELACEVIVKITRDSRIAVEVGGALRRPTLEYAHTLLDALPLGMLVVAPDQRVLYATPYLVGLLGVEPTRIDQDLIDRLANAGLGKLTLRGMEETVARFLENAVKTDDVVRVGASLVYATRLAILGDKYNENAVVLVLRPDLERADHAETSAS